MSNSKTYMIVGGIAAVGGVTLLAGWYMGWFSSESKTTSSSSSSTSSTEAAKLADEKIGELNIKDLKAIADNELDETIFKELVHSIKALISASEDLIKKIAAEFVKAKIETAENDESKKKITDDKVKLVKEKMDIYKTAFDSKDKFLEQYKLFNQILLSKAEDGKLVAKNFTKENNDLITKYKSILGEISSADTYKMDSGLKSAITTDKYGYTISESESGSISAFNAIGFGFITALIAE